MAVEILNDGNFEEKIKNSNKPVIVDFYADWCGPCKMVAPVFEDINTNNKEVQIYKVDVDKSGAVASKYGVMNIPTIICFKDGEVHKKQVGAMPKEGILDLTK